MWWFPGARASGRDPGRSSGSGTIAGGRLRTLLSCRFNEAGDLRPCGGGGVARTKQLAGDRRAERQANVFFGPWVADRSEPLRAGEIRKDVSERTRRLVGVGQAAGTETDELAGPGPVASIAGGGQSGRGRACRRTRDGKRHGAVDDDREQQEPEEHHRVGSYRWKRPCKVTGATCADRTGRRSDRDALRTDRRTRIRRHHPGAGTRSAGLLPGAARATPPAHAKTENIQ
jgi:hypothetical protein